MESTSATILATTVKIGISLMSSAVIFIPLLHLIRWIRSLRIFFSRFR